MEDAWECVKKSPVKVGDRLRVKVLGVGAKGDFYTKYEGLVIFIKEASKCSVDEGIYIEVIEVKDRHAFAKKI